jgi:hypothetical protein
VAVRGLVRSLHSNFGFYPQDAMVASFDLKMSGYSDRQAADFQRRALDAIQQMPGVSAAGYANLLPLDLATSDALVYANGTSDFRPDKAVADAMRYDISPGYVGAAQTVLIMGRDFTWHDDAGSPNVAIVNETFVRKVFGSVSNAIGGYFMRGREVPDLNRRTSARNVLSHQAGDEQLHGVGGALEPGCATGGDRDGENPERTGQRIACDSADLAG